MLGICRRARSRAAQQAVVIFRSFPARARGALLRTAVYPMDGRPCSSLEPAFRVLTVASPAIYVKEFSVSGCTVAERESRGPRLGRTMPCKSIQLRILCSLITAPAPLSVALPLHAHGIFMSGCDLPLESARVRKLPGHVSFKQICTL